MGSKHVGDTFTNKQGQKYQVLQHYKGTGKYLVRFEDGTEVVAFNCSVVNGTVMNRNTPSLYGKGIIGYGEYLIKDGGILTKTYSDWSGMFDRCYGEQNKKDYSDCEVMGNFIYYQFFADWVESHLIYQDGLKYEVDKDLLVKGNRTYNENTVSLLPVEVHRHIGVSKKVKNTDLPTGVVYVKSRNKYRVVCSTGGKTSHRGIFKTLEEAHQCYLDVKIDYAKLLIDRYEKYLTNRQKHALLLEETYL